MTRSGNTNAARAARMLATASYIGAGVIPGQGGGSLNLTPAQKANALKIIAGRQGYAARTVMSSPPTLTSAASTQIGSSNDGASATSVSTLDTTNIRICGPAELKNPGGPFLGIRGKYSQYGSTDLYWGGAGYSIEFTHTGTQFEVPAMLEATSRFRMLVNGQWASAAHWSKADFGNPADGFRLLRFNFGSSATRTIRLYFAFLDGPSWINIQSGASISLPALSANEPVTRNWGDSFIEAPYAYNTGYDVAGTLPIALGEQLGVSLPIPAGRSSNGFTKPIDGFTIPQRITANGPLITNSVHEIIYASVNDNDASDAAVTAGALLACQNLRAIKPDACITFVLPFTFDMNPTTQAKYDANKAGAMAFAATDPGIVIIETRDLPSINNGGTLPNGQTQESFDGVHPGKAWCAYVTPMIADRILPAWQAKAA